ncbi:hypothetical protein BJX76DRAFT_335294 [Aspergillus varians]
MVTLFLQSMILCHSQTHVRLRRRRVVQHRAEKRHGDIPSSPPPDMTEVDTEIEALFGPTTKRRRISVNLATPAIQRRKPHDSIETSPGPSPFAADPPSPSLPYRTTPQKTPRRPATPATGKPSIRGHPCFLVSSSSSSQPPPKPTFVLPRSPSPDQAEGLTTIPTPFSPSSHALRRRGRQRSSAPSYLPGGMAAEVRSWVLEMGTKREQQIYANLGRRNEAESSVDSTRYSLKLRISKVRQSALSSCGPLAFIQGQAMLSSEDRDSADDTTRNVLLMGAPRLRPGELRTSSRVPSLQAGDVVGVLRGLVWELRAGESPSPIPDHEQILRCESEQSPGLGRWLVGMEWEVMSCA